RIIGHCDPEELFLFTRTETFISALVRLRPGGCLFICAAQNRLACTPRPARLYKWSNLLQLRIIRNSSEEIRAPVQPCRLCRGADERRRASVRVASRFRA